VGHAANTKEETATVVFEELRQKKIDQAAFERECLEKERVRDVQRAIKKAKPLKLKLVPGCGKTLVRGRS